MLSKSYHVPTGTGGVAPLCLFSALLCCASAFAQALPEANADIELAPALQIGSVDVTRHAPGDGRALTTSANRRL